MKKRSSKASDSTNSRRRKAKKAFTPLAVNTELLEHYRELAGLSKKGLARMIGMDNAALHLLWRGKRRLRLEEAEPLARALNQPTNAVLEAFALGIRGVEGGGESAVPVKGWLDGLLVVREEGLRGKRSAPFAGPKGSAKGLVALRFQTAGTEHAVWDGALVFYRSTKTAIGVSIGENVLGRMSIVKIRGVDELRLREVKRGYEPGRYDLVSLSGRVLEKDVAIEAVHPIVSLVL